MQEARMDERMRTDEPETGELTVLKDVDVLTAEERQELEALLHERRRGDVAESQRMAESLGSLLASRSESTADDEHDPEGPTLSSEWSRLQALRSDAAHDIVAVDAALERLHRGTHGVWTRGRRALGGDRRRRAPPPRRRGRRVPGGWRSHGRRPPRRGSAGRVLNRLSGRRGKRPPGGGRGGPDTPLCGARCGVSGPLDLHARYEAGRDAR